MPETTRGEIHSVNVGGEHNINHPQAASSSPRALAPRKPPLLPEMEVCLSPSLKQGLHCEGWLYQVREGSL